MRRGLIAGAIALSCVLVALPPASAGAAGRLVYADAFGGSALRVLSAAGGHPLLLPGTLGGLRPRWAPDGSGAVFVGRHGAVAWVNADASDRHVLFPQRSLPGAAAQVETLAWSPDGSQLLLEVQGKTARPTLYLADPGAGSIRLLLHNAGNADWSINGRIVAVRGASLITFDPDGSDLIVVLRDSVLDPEWSPDGMRILFQRYAGSFDLFVMNADGSDRTNLTHSHAVDWSPTWSPDGTRIAWARSRSLFGFDDLFVMNADGSGVTRLTRTPKVDEYEPDWG